MYKSGGSVVGTLVVIAAIFGYKFYNKNSLSEDYRKQAHALVERCDLYAANKDYVDSLCDDAHDTAFGEAYHMGLGRRDRSTFDEDVYAMELIKGMIQQATADGSTHIAESLTRLIRSEMEAEEKAAAAPPTKPKKASRGR
jgi:hypothetical protein